MPMRASGVVATMRLRSAGSNWPSSGQAMAPGDDAVHANFGRELERQRAGQGGEAAFAML